MKMWVTMSCVILATSLLLGAITVSAEPTDSEYEFYFKGQRILRDPGGQLLIALGRYIFCSRFPSERAPDSTGTERAQGSTPLVYNKGDYIEMFVTKLPDELSVYLEVQKGPLDAAEVARLCRQHFLKMDERVQKRGENNEKTWGPKKESVTEMEMKEEVVAIWENVTAEIGKIGQDYGRLEREEDGAIRFLAKESVSYADHSPTKRKGTRKDGLLASLAKSTQETPSPNFPIPNGQFTVFVFNPKEGNHLPYAYTERGAIWEKSKSDIRVGYQLWKIA